MTDNHQVTELLKLLPTDLGDGVMLVAMIASVVGLGLFVAGVRVSRPLITLVTVSTGAAIGLQMPKWFGWSVSAAGPAVAGAVVLGVSGFVLHRMWIGLSLGLLVAMWAALTIWITMHGKNTWTWPSFDPQTTTIASYGKSVWANVPADMSRLIPWAAGVALVSALAATILWPRLMTAFFWSAFGVTTMLAMAGIMMTIGKHTDWLAKAPQKTATQIATLVTALLVGTAIQWKLSPKSAAAKLSAGAIAQSKPKDEMK